MDLILLYTATDHDTVTERGLPFAEHILQMAKFLFNMTSSLNSLSEVAIWITCKSSVSLAHRPPEAYI